MKKRLYFAHPINTYGTPLEAAIVTRILRYWEGYELVNPSDQVHKDKVLALRAKDPTVNVMPYFDEVVRSCDEIIVLPFADGKWGAGVWREVETLYAKDPMIQIWVIDPEKLDFSLITIDEIPPLKLTVDETRLRIRNPDGSSKTYA